MKAGAKPKNKYQVRQPPNFVNFYNRMEEQRKREIARKMKEEMVQNRKLSQSSGLERYERSSQGNKNTLAPKPSRDNPGRDAAPEIQYRKCLSDTTNVFYEDREQLVSIRRYEVYKPMVLKTAFVLFLAWFMLLFVQPYKGTCPANADCGVYVYCHEGYTLVNNRCIISEQTKKLVSYLCQSVVTNLKQQYGTQDCQSDVAKTVPTKTLSQIYDQYEIPTRAVEQEMFSWFSQRKNQQKFDFSFHDDRVRPIAKEYTIFCRFQKVVNSRGFYLFFSIFVVAFMFLLCWIRLHNEKRRATRIYEALKKQVIEQQDICIDINEIEKNYGKIYSEMWHMIDTARVQDKAIGYYEDEKLHWRLI